MQQPDHDACKAENAKQLGTRQHTFAGAFLVGVAMVCLAGGNPARAQEAAEMQPAASRAVIPQQVRYAGKLAARSGESVEAVFRIYSSAEGGEALWTETQQVSVSADGSYSVLLGTSTTAGLPQSVFAGGAARWLGVTVERGEEQERALLSSVPYAMKSADAELLAGHQAADFATQAQLAGLAQKVSKVEQTAATPAFQPGVTPTGSGTTNAIPLWTSSSTLGNSSITQVGGKIGINFAAPTATLEVGGPMTVHGTLLFPPGAPATSTHSSQSQSFQFSASEWNSTNAAPQSSTYTFLAGPTGNNTANPNAIFYLEYQNGSAAATSLLTVNGSGVLNPAGGILSNGSIALTPSTPATATTAQNSPLLSLGASSWTSTGSGGPRAQTFAWQAQPVGNDTASPTGKLSLLYGYNGATPAATGLSIANTGQITFAAGQQFPVAGTAGGTITGITSASPLTGSGTSGSVTLGLNETQLVNDITPTLQSNFNNDYAQLGASNSYSVQQSVQGYVLSSAFYGQIFDPSNGNAVVLGIDGDSHTETYGAFSNNYSTGVLGDAQGGGGDNPVGVIGTADSGLAGLFANNSATNPALYVNNAGGNGADFSTTSSQAYGLSGTSSDGNGVRGITTDGIAGVAGTVTTPDLLEAGVLGVATSPSISGQDFLVYAGVWGDTSVMGLSGEVVPVGIFGSADDSVAAVFGNNSVGFPTISLFNSSGGPTGGGSAMFKTLMASDAAGTCGIGSGSMTCTGPVKSLATTGQGGRRVETYSVQSSENWMEDAGSGELKRGVALVHIDPAFAETISADASYHVFITPNGDSDGLYVIAKTATTFEVRESKGGTSSLSFDYRIMAKRRGMETMRLTDVTERYNAEMKNVSRMQSGHGAAAHAREMHPPTAPAVKARPATPRRPEAAKPAQHQQASNVP